MNLTSLSQHLKYKFQVPIVNYTCWLQMYEQHVQILTLSQKFKSHFKLMDWLSEWLKETKLMLNITRINRRGWEISQVTDRNFFPKFNCDLSSIKKVSNEIYFQFSLFTWGSAKGANEVSITVKFRFFSRVGLESFGDVQGYRQALAYVATKHA